MYLNKNIRLAIITFSHDLVIEIFHKLMFSRESNAQTQATCNEVMDLQVDYWTTGGKKESNKVNYNLVPRLSPHNPKLNWVN
jgi:hypothetical protein